MKGVLNFLLKKPLGQGILIASLVVLSAYAGRLYYVDLPKMQMEEAAKAGPEQLEASASALNDAMSAAANKTAFVDSLPKMTEWYPASLPCDASADYPAPRDAVWDTLQLPKDGKTEFQYRFNRHDTGFVIRARRDSDCDGVYVVHTLRGGTDWSAVVGTKLTSENFDE